MLPDLDFLPAVLLLTRVVSKPGDEPSVPGSRAQGRGVREPAASRGVLMALPDTTAVGHSEEHLVLETDRAGEFPVGSRFYGMPWHICPTVALHNEAVVVRDGRAEERWQVVGRARTITI